jgi:hypothetical protein
MIHDFALTRVRPHTFVSRRIVPHQGEVDVSEATAIRHLHVVELILAVSLEAALVPPMGVVDLDMDNKFGLQKKNE